MVTKIYRITQQNGIRIIEHTGGEKVLYILEDGTEITSRVETPIQEFVPLPQKNLEQRLDDIEMLILGQSGIIGGV